MYKADRETVFEGVRELLAYYRIPDVSLPPGLSEEGSGGAVPGGVPRGTGPGLVPQRRQRAQSGCDKGK